MKTGCVALGALWLILYPADRAFAPLQSVHTPYCELLDRAQLIVCGEVARQHQITVAVAEPGRTDQNSYQFEIDKPTVLKGGPVNAPIIVTYSPLADARKSISFRNGQRRVFFLSRDAASYQLIGTPACPRISPGAKVESQVRDPQERLVSLLCQSLKGGSDDVVEDCIEVLAQLNAKNASSALQSVVSRSNIRLRGRAIAALLELGEDHMVSVEAEHYLDAVGPTTRPASAAETEAYLGWTAVANAIGKTHDRAALPVLHRLTASPNPYLREQAVYALRRIADRTSAPYLASALTDKEFDVRYQALMGLWAVTGRVHMDWAAAIPLVREDESKYVGAALRWWKTEGKNQDWSMPNSTEQSE